MSEITMKDIQAKFHSYQKDEDEYNKTLEQKKRNSWEIKTNIYCILFSTLPLVILHSCFRYSIWWIILDIIFSIMIFSVIESIYMSREFITKRYVKYFGKTPYSCDLDNKLADILWEIYKARKNKNLQRPQTKKQRFEQLKREKIDRDNFFAFYEQLTKDKDYREAFFSLDNKQK